MFETRHHQQWCFFIFDELEQGRIGPAPETTFIRSFAEPLCSPFPAPIWNSKLDPTSSNQTCWFVLWWGERRFWWWCWTCRGRVGSHRGCVRKSSARVSHWLFSYPPLARGIVLSAPHRLSRLFQDQQTRRRRTRRSSTGKRCWAGESDPRQSSSWYGRCQRYPLRGRYLVTGFQIQSIYKWNPTRTLLHKLLS